MTHPPGDSAADAFHAHDTGHCKSRRDLDVIFRAGTEARESGRSIHDNPYAAGSEERDEWTAGYRATPDRDRDDSDSPL